MTRMLTRVNLAVQPQLPTPEIFTPVVISHLHILFDQLFTLLPSHLTQLTLA